MCAGSRWSQKNWTKLDWIYALVRRLANVGTLVGLPPTPCAFDRFLSTAKVRCTFDMRSALTAFD